MEKEKAKEFWFIDHDSKKIYISKDVQVLIDLNDGRLISVFAVVETAVGDKLFEMDFAYSGEPIIMRVFLHKEFILNWYIDYRVVDV